MVTTVITFVSAQYGRIAPVLRLLRLQPFNVSTPQGRSSERHRRAALTTLASVLAKLISITTALVSVPLTLHYLGSERYGMWMTMSSLVAMLNFADFGIGTGVLNAVSAAHGKDHPSAIKEYVSSGCVVLTAIAVVIVALFAGAYRFVPWFKLFNVTSQVARVDAAPALAVLIACFALAIPLGVIQRVQLELQKGFMANLWQCAGQPAGIGGHHHCHHSACRASNAYSGLRRGPARGFGPERRRVLRLAGAADSAKLSGRRCQAICRIAQSDSLVVLQAVIALTFYSDNIVIAQLLGASAVAAYSVAQRLFSTVGVVVGMALWSLWPAYGEADARGDHSWVRLTLKRSFFAAVWLSACASIVLFFTGNWIIEKWVGHGLEAPLLLLLGLGFLQVVMCGGGAISAYLNGTNFVRFQVIVGVLTAVVAIALKILLVPVIGNSGVVWASVASYALLTLLPSYFFIRKRLKA